jgi:CRISPR-associated protein Csb2
MPVLLLSARFHDGRYHGTGDWPPAPARLFQALVAAAAKPALGQASCEALMWLEQLEAPVIAVPPMHKGQFFKRFEPNNDLDAKGGDIRRVAEIRAATKEIHPKLFDASIPLLYLWHFDGEDTHAKHICTIADGLYQLGRGVDMAWATAEVLDEAQAEEYLAQHPGVIYRPSVGKNSSDGLELACPEQDSLNSLIERHKANAQRFRPNGTKIEFANAPKPRFRQVAYNSPAARLLFDIRRTTDTGTPFAPWPLKNAAALVSQLRDGAVDKLQRLNHPAPFDEGTVGKVLIGRDATEADKALRVRIVPIPSIGFIHADRGIRRVLVEVPPDCPIRADDMAWTFAGLMLEQPIVDENTGELLSSPVELVRANDDSMLAHYGIGSEARPSRLWRSVTPFALPVMRRRIAPNHLQEQSKNGNERHAENRDAIHAVMQTLRHAGLRHRVANVRVQREPFEVKGERAEAFANETRFSKHQLWHVEIEFTEAVSGPLLLGSGRYTGLGLMVPVRQIEGIYAFSITDGLTDGTDTLELARALRRAVMARVQDELGKYKKLPVFFTGHEIDGSTARRGGHNHLAFVPDLIRQRLLVIAPHVFEHRAPQGDESDNLKTLSRALADLSELRAGSAGKLRLEHIQVDLDSDPLFAASKVWASATPYKATRHAKRNGRDSLQEDVRRDVLRRKLPVPDAVECRDTHTLLRFNVSVAGPVLLGKTMHFGGGIFTRLAQPDAITPDTAPPPSTSFRI